VRNRAFRTSLRRAGGHVEACSNPPVAQGALKAPDIVANVVLERPDERAGAARLHVRALLRLEERLDLPRVRALCKVVVWPCATSDRVVRCIACCGPDAVATCRKDDRAGSARRPATPASLLRTAPRSAMIPLQHLCHWGDIGDLPARAHSPMRGGSPPCSMYAVSSCFPLRCAHIRCCATDIEPNCGPAQSSWYLLKATPLGLGHIRPRGAERAH